MTTLISERVAIWALGLILTLVVLFHLAVVLGLIPFSIVWGGRLKTPMEIVQFETVSILLNLIMLGIVVLKARLLPFTVKPITFQVAFGLMSGLFLLNTVGNLLSTNDLEQVLFTPLTLLLSLLSLRLAIGKERPIA